MTAPADAAAVEARIAEAWLEHAYPGEVTTALDVAWIVCECGERVDVPVVDLRVSHADVRAAFSAHVAAVLAPLVAAEVARATPGTCSWPVPPASSARRASDERDT